MDEKTELGNLKFLGKIPQGGYKLNTKLMYLERDTLYGMVRRNTWWNDTKENGLAFIRKTIENAFEILKKYEKSDNPKEREMCSYIIKDLYLSEIGIENFKSNYGKYESFCAEVEMILQDIKINLKIIEDKRKAVDMTSSVEEGLGGK